MRQIKNILIFILVLIINIIIINVLFNWNTISYINEHDLNIINIDYFYTDSHQLVVVFILSIIITIFITLLFKIYRDTLLQNTLLEKIADSQYKNTNRFEEFANMLPEGLYETDLDGIVTFATENFSHILDVERAEELIGKNIFSFLDKESIDIAKKNFKKILQQDIRIPREYTIQTNSGKKYFILQAHRKINETGKTIGTRGVVIDITEITQLRNEYSANYKILELTLDAIQVPVYLQNMRGEITNFNPAFMNFCNKKHEDEIRNKTVFDLLPHEISRIFYKKIIELMRSNSHFNSFNIQHDKFDIFVNQTKFINEEDKFAGGVITTIQDLTTINSIKNKLSASEESFKVLSDGSIFGVVISKNGEIAYINDKLSDILGYKKNEVLLTKPFIQKVVIGDDQNKFLGMLDYIEDHDKVGGRLKIRTKSGILKYIEVYIKKIEYEGGFSNLITVLDITPYININKQKRQ